STTTRNNTTKVVPTNNDKQQPVIDVATMTTAATTPILPKKVTHAQLQADFDPPTEEDNKMDDDGQEMGQEGENN
ncbi:unnamed protein product, partial [Amoebophrya sp. A25]